MVYRHRPLCCDIGGILYVFSMVCVLCRITKSHHSARLGGVVKFVRRGVYAPVLLPVYKIAVKIDSNPSHTAYPRYDADSKGMPALGSAKATSPPTTPDTRITKVAIKGRMIFLQKGR